MRLEFKNWIFAETGGLMGNPGTVPNEPTPTSACPACVSFNLYPPPKPSTSAPALLAKSFPGNAGASGGPAPKAGGGAAAAPAAAPAAGGGIPATTPIV